MSLRALKWPLLSVVPPRACLIALNFCQPLLINRAIILSIDDVTQKSIDVGYGLIGAYVLVYIGIAVCETSRSYVSNTSLTTLFELGHNGAVSASDIPRHNHGQGRPCLHALQKDN